MSHSSNTAAGADEADGWVGCAWAGSARPAACRYLQQHRYSGRGRGCGHGGRARLVVARAAPLHPPVRVACALGAHLQSTVVGPVPACSPLQRCDHAVAPQLAPESHLNLLVSACPSSRRCRPASSRPGTIATSCGAWWCTPAARLRGTTTRTSRQAVFTAWVGNYFWHALRGSTTRWIRQAAFTIGLGG